MTTPIFISDKLIPTRLIVSGVKTLGAGATDIYLGENARQKRIQFVITNMSATDSLYIRDESGRSFAICFPQRQFTLETSADIYIFNNSAGGIQYCVGELFPERDYRS